MTKRKPRNAKERARLFKLFGGRCYLCGGQIDGIREAWEIEHRTALELGGADEDHNLSLAHAKCHKSKTRDDVGMIARAKRREARHTGARVPKSSIPSPPRMKREPRRLAASLPPLQPKRMFR